MKSKKLSVSLSATVALLVVACVTVLSVFSIVSSSDTVKRRTRGEFTAIGQSNAVEIQLIFDESSSAAARICTQIERLLARASSRKGSVASAIPGLKVSEALADIEAYLISEFKPLVLDSKSIIGMGVFFEPYQFASDIEHYALYMDAAACAADKVELYTDDYGAEEYYSGALREDRIFVTDPFVFDGINMITLAQPIHFGGKVIGTVSADLALDAFSAIQISSEDYPSMFAGIISDTGTIVYDSGHTDMIGQDFSELFTQADKYAQIQSSFAQGEPFSIETARINGDVVTRFFSPITCADEGWWAQTSLSTSDMTKEAAQLTLFLVGISLAAVILIIALLFSRLRRELKPLDKLSEAARQLEGGNFDFALDISSANEIGELARLFNAMAQRVTFIIADIGDILESMAGGDFTAVTSDESQYTGEYKHLLLSVRSIRDKLGDVLKGVRMASEQIAMGSQQISMGSQTLAQGATEQAAAVEELSSSITEVSSHVDDTYSKAKEAADITRHAGSTMNVSLGEMAKLLEAMAQIEHTSNDISKVIKVIEDIAFQTNILALNAAVEAARAGDAGRGFAVVADEVRTLAQRSAESAKSSAELLIRSAEAVVQGRALANSAEVSFTETNRLAGLVAQGMDEITMAAGEQSAQLRQISTGVEQISSVVQTTAATAEESAAASEQLLKQAHSLDEIMRKLKTME